MCTRRAYVFISQSVTCRDDCKSGGAGGAGNYPMQFTKICIVTKEPNFLRVNTESHELIYIYLFILVHN